MIDFLRENARYLVGALLLHVLFAAIFSITAITTAPQQATPQLAIQAVVIDASQLGAASRERERERERAEAQAREQAAAERRREQEEAARREAEQRAEQERQAVLKRQQEAEQRRLQEEQAARERQEAERQREAQAKAEAERQRRAEEERKRAAEIERRQKEEAERRRAAQEARAQEARENELARQLAEEEGRMQAENAGLLNQYIAMIEQRIVRNWNRPPSARAGLECEVRVTQTPGGAVLTVQIGRCNGDAAVQQSIEAAVQRSSPLPPPPDPRLFQRTLILIFKPAD